MEQDQAAALCPFVAGSNLNSSIDLLAISYRQFIMAWASTKGGRSKEAQYFFLFNRGTADHLVGSAIRDMECAVYFAYACCEYHLVHLPVELVVKFRLQYGFRVPAQEYSPPRKWLDRPSQLDKEIYEELCNNLRRIHVDEPVCRIQDSLPHVLILAQLLQHII